MKIIGTGSALPVLAVTNDMIAEILDTSDEWITTRTGVKERRILTEETLTDIAVDAAKKAIQDANIASTDLDYIICSNLVNSYATPSLSSIIQGGIGATCPCLDINVACAGFVFALDISEAFLKMGKVKNILIVCAEEPSRIVDWTQRDASILFGDGAAAAVITEGDDLKAMQLSTTSTIEALYYHRKMEYNPFNTKDENTGPLVMNGKEIYKLAVSASTSEINKVLNDTGLSVDDISYFICHQANLRIIEAIRQHLNQPKSKFPHNIEKYGNTASATIPILLDELHKSKKLKRGDLLVFSAFGAGFTTGTCIIRWSGNNNK